MTARETVEGASRQAEVHSVLRRTVCLLLTCHSLGNSRNVDLASVEMTKRRSPGDEERIANKSEYRLTQRLVDTAILSPANAALGQVKEYLRSVSTAGHRVFGPGTYLVPIALVRDVDARLRQLREELDAAGARVAAQWQDEIARRRVALGPTFNAADYPSPEDVRAAFGFDWDYVKFSSPELLMDVDVALAEASVERHERRLAAAFDEIVLGMRADALQMVTQLVDKLGDRSDGKPKALQPTALRDLQSYLDLLPRRNSVAGDDALADALAQLQAFSEGVDVETLRKAPAVRAEMRRKAEAAAAALGGLVEASRGRALALGAGGLLGAQQP